jgi:hypothetical protein
MSVTRPYPPPMTLTKGRLVVQRGSRPRYSLPFQYNPETVTRSLSLNANDAPEEERNEAPSFRSAAGGSITIAARFEASPGDSGTTGVLPQMAAIELLLYPDSDDVRAAESALDAGKRKIVSWPTPSVVLEWGQRAVPVILKSVSVDEQEFDPMLNPIRAVLTLSFDVVTYSSVGDADPRGQLFLEHQKKLEALASSAQKPMGG